MTPEARWRGLFCAYVLVQLALRFASGPALELDEAEAFLHGQHLALGYGPQPPLYFWIQWGFFQVLGETILALAAFKALILGGTLLLVFEFLRREVPVAVAGAATLSLGFLVQVVYEGQRSFTHSSMALLAAVAMGWALIRALRSGRWGDHVLLGIATGVGLLSKLNVAVWAGGLILAALLIPEWRRRLRVGPMLGAVAVALLLNAPVGAWMLANPDLALRSAGKFEVGSGTGAAAEGLGVLALAALSFNGIGLLAVGLAWVFGREPGARPGAPSGVRLLLASSGLSLLLVGAGILASGSTEVRDRWLLPLSWFVVPGAVAWIWPALTARARRALAGTAAACWLAAAAIIPYGSLRDPGYRASDWTGMEAALREEGAGQVPVLVTNTWPAGNLLLRGATPGLRYLARIEELPDGPAILVTTTTSREPDRPEVVARTLSRRIVEVPRGSRTRSFAVLRLGAT